MKKRQIYHRLSWQHAVMIMLVCDDPVLLPSLLDFVLVLCWYHTAVISIRNRFIDFLLKFHFSVIHWSVLYKDVTVCCSDSTT